MELKIEFTWDKRDEIGKPETAISIVLVEVTKNETVLIRHLEIAECREMMLKNGVGVFGVPSSSMDGRHGETDTWTDVDPRDAEYEREQAVANV